MISRNTPSCRIPGSPTATKSTLTISSTERSTRNLPGSRKSTSVHVRQRRMDWSTSGSTLAASTNPAAPSSKKPLRPCSHGTATPQSVTSTLQMYPCPTRPPASHSTNLGSTLSVSVGGSLVVGHFKNLLHPQQSSSFQLKALRSETDNPSNNTFMRSQASLIELSAEPI